MDLVRDLLDEQLVDRKERRMGKVDGIVLQVEPGSQPRVKAIEVGPVTMLRRVHPSLARWMAALMQRLGVGSGEPLRVPFEKLKKQGITLRADVDIERTSAYAWERWLRERVIGRIPWSGL